MRSYNRPKGDNENRTNTVLSEQEGVRALRDRKIHIVELLRLRFLKRLGVKSLALASSGDDPGRFKFVKHD